MKFLYTDDQKSFQESIGDFLAQECTPETIRASWETETARSPDLWSKLAGMGITGMLAPEGSGGLGLSELELVLPLSELELVLPPEETGRVALPEPVLETAALAVRLVRDCGNPEIHQKWLPRLVSGEAIATVGLAINPVVSDAHIADLLLLQNGEDEIHAVEKAQVSCIPQPATDPSRKLFTIAWTPSAETCIASGEKGRQLLAATLDRAALGIAAQLIGAAQKMVDIAVDYAKDRQQFGVAIGSFQAVKHMIASVQVAIEFARAPLARAAWSVAEGSITRATDVSQAKLLASDAALQAARVALQVHGGIGYTWEVHLHIWMKRVWALEASFGTRAWHRRRIGAALFGSEETLPSFGFDSEV